ncbi:MAG: FKBP-type peptidyl-prolyl cis-trans isomerase [Planctomycetota bacterium]
MRALASIALLLVASALGSSCRQLRIGSSPVPMNRESVRTTSGLAYVEIFVGTGPAAKAGDQVTFEYTVWLQDGTRVDSTYDRGVAITVEIGRAALPAWNEGLLGIQPQGRRRLTVPPELAYGEQGVEGMIPPDSTLVIEVLALEVEEAGSSTGP